MVSPQTGEESFQTAETALHPLEDYPKQRTRGVLISLRAYPKIAAYCFALSLSTLLTGFDVIILVSITALPPFQ